MRKKLIPFSQQKPMTVAPIATLALGLQVATLDIN
jgi:hypothetical protein